VFPDHIISLENGRKFKSMKRHLGLLGMTPDEYRAKWGARDYPVVAPSYAAQRSKLAKASGLGRKVSCKNAHQQEGANQEGTSQAGEGLRRPCLRQRTNAMTRQSIAEELESAADSIADISRADLQIILRRAVLMDGTY
jgi:ROS/MUCR transcriptional regulator protein